MNENAEKAALITNVLVAVIDYYVAASRSAAAVAPTAKLTSMAALDLSDAIEAVMDAGALE